MRTDRQKAVAAGLAALGLLVFAMGTLVGPEWTPGGGAAAADLIADGLSIAALMLLLLAGFAWWASSPTRDFGTSAPRAHAASLHVVDAPDPLDPPSQGNGPARQLRARPAATRRPGEPARRTRSLDRASRDARVGKAAENYVGAIVQRVARDTHQVRVGVKLGPPDISFHHGDVDFLLEGRDGAPSFLLEVKASDPRRRGGAEGERHAAQAARGRRAVVEMTGGATNPVPIVVYVDPIGSGSSVLKSLPLEPSTSHAGVWSVGARGLEKALRDLAEDLARAMG